jgi:lysophospholipase L1-like esterase
LKTSLRLLLSTALVAAALLGTGNSAGAVSSSTYYVSLGDSLAAGEQPIGSFNRGYANQLFKEVRHGIPGLRLVKLGCSGETTASMISGIDSGCTYPSGSQLDEAVSFLQAHPGQISFVTIDIGANDWLGACFDGILVHLACTESILPGVARNLRTILEALQAAAPGVPIAGMSYYDPFLGFWVLDPVNGEAIARHDAAVEEVFNAGLVATFEDEGVVVADVAGAFDIANFTDLVDTKKFGVVPVNVANTCILTWFCSRFVDVHPKRDGYTLIADAFEEVLGHS